MTQEETNNFRVTVEALSTYYPHRNVQMKQEFGNEYVYVDGEPKFCATGYNLLFNLTRLCQTLSNELL